MNWLFKPDSPGDMVEDIYIHTLPLAVAGAVQKARSPRVKGPRDDEIAARIMTAAIPPKRGVQ